LKFKLDENLGTLGIDILASAGHDVATTVEQQLSGVSDSQLYEVYCREQRVLITLDHDFGHVLRFPPEPSAGIVVLECRGRLSPTTIGERIREFAAVLAERTIDRELWIVEPGRVRVHQRPEPTARPSSTTDGK
jgi:predicted nuclease of predicted toxin-antitoxin system